MKWTDQHGEEWDIRDMSSRYIRNCIRMLERNTEYKNKLALEQGYNVLDGMQGEMAQESIFSYLRSFESEPPEPQDYYPIYNEFKKELERRTDGPSNNFF